MLAAIAISARGAVHRRGDADAVHRALTAALGRADARSSARPRPASRSPSARSSTSARADAGPHVTPPAAASSARTSRRPGTQPGRRNVLPGQQPAERLALVLAGDQHHADRRRRQRRHGERHARNERLPARLGHVDDPPVADLHLGTPGEQRRRVPVRAQPVDGEVERTGRRRSARAASARSRPRRRSSPSIGYVRAGTRDRSARMAIPTSERSSSAGTQRSSPKKASTSVHG